MTISGKLTLGDFYKLAAALTSLGILAFGCADVVPDGKIKHALQIVGAVSTAIHAALLDPRVISQLAVLQSVFGPAEAPK